MGSTVQTSGVTANDFTNPVVYTVTAADGSTQNYTVTVTVALQSSKAITAYSIVSPSATGTITGTSIAVLVPHGTIVTALAAYFTTTGVSVKVGSTAQSSGVTTNNFTNPVVYIVTAADGSTQNYTATVTVASFATYTTANGLGSNTVNRITVSGSTIYASTWGGLSISTNGGTSWTNYTTANGLGNNYVSDVAVSGSTIYASTGYSSMPGGVSISTNGTSWTNYTSGLISNEVSDVAVSGSTIYAATWAEVSKSINGGSTWTTLLSGYTPNERSRLRLNDLLRE